MNECPRFGGYRRFFYWRDLHPGAELIIDLLERGEGWTSDSYRLVHERAGVSLWIANEFYGFGVRADGLTASPHDNNLRLDRWSTRILYGYVEAYQRSALSTRHSEAMTQFARRYITAVNTSEAA